MDLAEGFKARWVELVIWNDALTTSQISTLNTYFGGRWGIDTAPEITSISSSLVGDNQFGIGESISLKVDFSENVTLAAGSTVEVDLVVNLVGGGTTTLKASYTNTGVSGHTATSFTLSTAALTANNLLDNDGVEVVANSCFCNWFIARLRREQCWNFTRRNSQYQR